MAHASTFTGTRRGVARQSTALPGRLGSRRAQARQHCRIAAGVDSSPAADPTKPALDAATAYGRAAIDSLGALRASHGLAAIAVPPVGLPIAPRTYVPPSTAWLDVHLAANAPPKHVFAVARYEKIFFPVHLHILDTMLSGALQAMYMAGVPPHVLDPSEGASDPMGTELVHLLGMEADPSLRLNRGLPNSFLAFAAAMRACLPLTIAAFEGNDDATQEDPPFIHESHRRPGGGMPWLVMSSWFQVQALHCAVLQICMQSVLRAIEVGGPAARLLAHPWSSIRLIDGMVADFVRREGIRRSPSHRLYRVVPVGHVALALITAAHSPPPALFRATLVDAVRHAQLITTSRFGARLHLASLLPVLLTFADGVGIYNCNPCDLMYALHNKLVDARNRTPPDQSWIWDGASGLLLRSVHCGVNAAQFGKVPWFEVLQSVIPKLLEVIKTQVERDDVDGRFRHDFASVIPDPALPARPPFPGELPPSGSALHLAPVAAPVASENDTNATFAFENIQADLIAAAGDAFAARGVPAWAFDKGLGVGPCSRADEHAHLLPPCLGGSASGWSVDQHFCDSMQIARSALGLPAEPAFALRPALRRPPAYAPALSYAVSGSVLSFSPREQCAQLALEKFRADSLRILDAARWRWPAVQRALLHRVTGGRLIGSMSGLPEIVLTALATAQAHQETMFAVVRDSVRREAAARGAAGARLVAAFADETQFGATVARLIGSAGTPLRMSILEFAGGVLPVGYLAVALVLAWRLPTVDTRGQSLVTLAAATSIVDAKTRRLDITNGAKELIAAWIEARKNDIPFPTSDLHAQILVFISNSAHATGTRHIVAWDVEVRRLMADGARRSLAAQRLRRTVHYSLEETSDLMDWLQQVGNDLDDAEVALRDWMAQALYSHGPPRATSTASVDKRDPSADCVPSSAAADILTGAPSIRVPLPEFSCVVPRGDKRMIRTFRAGAATQAAPGTTRCGAGICSGDVRVFDRNGGDVLDPGLARRTNKRSSVAGGDVLDPGSARTSDKLSSVAGGDVLDPGSARTTDTLSSVAGGDVLDPGSVRTTDTLSGVAGGDVLDRAKTLNRYCLA